MTDQEKRIEEASNKFIVGQGNNDIGLNAYPANLGFKAGAKWALETELASLRSELAEKEKENVNLKTCMIAAAEEIVSQWPAHCDKDGYGPSNLMHRLEQGIPSQYGYTAGAFEKMEQEIALLKQQYTEKDILMDRKIMEINRLNQVCEAADKVIEAYRSQIYNGTDGKKHLKALEVYDQLKNTKPSPQ